ncbi:ComF family protein [Halobacillus amylolyticus]|uniref:ComF family protein n=1 Tax=Halobacillus amylolyticus TaxID=2932259 RepID=A0ABY4HB59_9BACI|nr:ComF family protein [Halobacillus amylolyticus]UOR11667.1 ComF family protein [Halobacillus amylolyticus]
MRCLICVEEIVPKVGWGQFLLPQKKINLCEVCSARLARIDLAGCPKCGRVDAEGVCYDCVRWEHSVQYAGCLEKNVSVYMYNEFAREVVARWKYRGDFILIEAFAGALQTTYHQHFRDVGADVVAIPLSEQRFRERGFNQSDAIIAQLGFDAVDFFKRKDSEKQSKRGRRERMGADNPFVLVGEPRKPVLLVDDIYTTGMTVRHLASLLKMNGCPVVYSLTLFR